jgi:hypothetical protein
MKTGAGLPMKLSYGQHKDICAVAYSSDGRHVIAASKGMFTLFTY